MGNGCNGHTLVNNRNAVLLFDVNTGCYQMLGSFGNFIVDPLAEAIGILAHAIPKGNAHGDGADVEVFLTDHFNGFQYVARIDHVRVPP